MPVLLITALDTSHMIFKMCSIPIVVFLVIVGFDDLFVSSDWGLWL